MDAIFRLMGAFATPLMFLNLFGGIVAGIWLAILGDWGSIGYGLAGLILSHLFLALAMIPGLLLAAPGLVFYSKNGMRWLSYPFFLAGALYNVVLTSVWCVFVLWFFLDRADNTSFIPLVIWAYGAATGPFAYMASKENQSVRGGEDEIGMVSRIILVFFVQIGFVAMALAVMFFGVTVLDAATMFSAFMIASALIQFSSGVAMRRELDALSSPN